jgi:hypothetical protein
MKILHFTTNATSPDRPAMTTRPQDAAAFRRFEHESWKLRSSEGSIRAA